MVPYNYSEKRCYARVYIIKGYFCQFCLEFPVVDSLQVNVAVIRLTFLDNYVYRGIITIDIPYSSIST